MAERATPSEQTQADALKQFHILPDEAGVRLPTVRGILACSSATIWRLAKAEKIKARKISERVTVFNVGSIRALLNGGCK
jgi:predicted DNA-binding transcriptional regulator AlpA